MKIILLKDIAHVGKENELKEVRDGFARNFLFPQKLAIPATEQTQRALVVKKEHEEKKRSAEQQRYVKLAEKLRSLRVVMKMKVGEKRKAFGSVNAAKIVEHLQAQHHVAIEKSWLHLDEPLKSTGIKEIPIRFPHGVEGELHVHILPDEESGKFPPLEVRGEGELR